MKKIKICVFFLFVIINFNANANDSEFEKWKEKFKLIALERGVSLNTIENTVGKSSFLKNVIKYDRYQPEFYEDTKTYESVVLDRAGISSILFGNLTINGRLDGNAMRYRYLDGTTVKIADISTSRVSAWSSSDDKATCLLYTSPSPRDRTRSRMPSSA